MNFLRRKSGKTMGTKGVIWIVWLRAIAHIYYVITTKQHTKSMKPAPTR